MQTPELMNEIFFVVGGRPYVLLQATGDGGRFAIADFYDRRIVETGSSSELLVKLACLGGLPMKDHRSRFDYPDLLEGSAHAG